LAVKEASKRVIFDLIEAFLGVIEGKLLAGRDPNRCKPV
jgi:hypothetical protein